MLETTIGIDIEYAADILRRGGLVAIPTETVYGLAANALDANAVARIFEAKERPSFDPLIVHIRSAAHMHEYAASVPQWAERCAEAFWPGPLTIVLPKRGIIPDIVTSGLATVGLRAPKHSLAESLLSTLDFPLAAPSANPFGYISPTTAEHVFEQLAGKIDYILDGGQCNVGVESTIIVEVDFLPTILRLGGLSVEELANVIPDVRMNTHSSSTPSAPGMLESHYAPRTRVFIGAPTYDDLRTGYLGFSKRLPQLDAMRQIILSPSGDLHEAARNVFAALHTLEAMNVDKIYVELAPEVGLGRAINDRLRRASAKSESEVS